MKKTYKPQLYILRRKSDKQIQFFENGEMGVYWQKEQAQTMADKTRDIDGSIIWEVRKCRIIVY